MISDVIRGDVHAYLAAAIYANNANAQVRLAS